MKRFLTLLIGISLLLVACNGTPDRDENLPEQPGGTAVPNTPSLETATLMPTETGETSVLPDPLYFISADDQQIWRLEPDGVTLTPITHAATPVTAFDIREVLVYVTDNDLFRADLFGQDPFLLVDGPDLPTDDLNARLNLAITNPRLSQAPNLLAFGMGGVNTISVTGGEPQLVLPNPSPAIHYRPSSWYVPQLLVEYTDSAGNSGFVIWGSLATTEVIQPPLQNCCQPSWEPYLGLAVYFANDSGLYEYDLTNDETTVIIDNSNNPTAIRFPRATGYGSVYFFKEVSANGDSLSMTMYRVGGDNEERLRDDSHIIGEVSWNFGDPTGAVIVELTSPLAADPAHGPLLWLPADGRPAVRLPADGYHLRWSNNSFVP
jgi:hypothetical protein